MTTPVAGQSHTLAALFAAAAKPASAASAPASPATQKADAMTEAAPKAGASPYGPFKGRHLNIVV